MVETPCMVETACMVETPCMVETSTKHQNIYLAKKNCPVFPPENTGSLETIEAWKKHVYQVSQGISAIY